MASSKLAGRDDFSEEEYWKLEETSAFRNEYWNGQILPMRSGTFIHALIIANVVGIVGNQLDENPCVALGSGMRVKVTKSTHNFNTYPDISIACPSFEFEARRSGVKDTLLNPRVIFEVLSPSTMEYDQNDKFDEYKLLDSLTDYVLVWSERVRVKHYYRNADNEWIEKIYNQCDEEFRLSSIEITLSLQEIYDGLEMDETPIFRLANDEDDE